MGGVWLNPPDRITRLVGDRWPSLSLSSCPLTRNKSYNPGVARSRNIWKKGTDTVLFLGTSHLIPLVNLTRLPTKSFFLVYFSPWQVNGERTIILALIFWTAQWRADGAPTESPLPFSVSISYFNDRTLLLLITSCNACSWNFPFHLIFFSTKKINYRRARWPTVVTNVGPR